MKSEDSDRQTERHWDDLYKHGLGAPRYPNGYAVRWLFSNFPRGKASQYKLLDLGTGMGRHAMLMAREGYDVTGTDYSETSIQLAKSWAEEEGMDIKFEQASAERQPFPDCSFDGIISYAVVYYLPYEQLILAINEIYRLLKDGGTAFVMIKNDRDIRKSKGKMIAPYHYEITTHDEGMPWNNEIGMGVTLLPKSEVISIFDQFSEIKIEEMTSTLGGGKYLEAAWLIYVKK